MKPFNKITYEEALVEEAAREFAEYLEKQKKKQQAKEKGKS